MKVSRCLARSDTSACVLVEDPVNIVISDAMLNISLGQDSASGDFVQVYWWTLLIVLNVFWVRHNVLLSPYVLNNWTCNVHTLMSLYEQWGIITIMRCQGGTVTASDIKYHHSSPNIPIRIAWGVHINVFAMVSHWSDHDNGNVSLVNLSCCHANSDWPLLTSDAAQSKQNESSHMNYAHLTRSDMLMFIYLGIFSISENIKVFYLR